MSRLKIVIIFVFVFLTYSVAWSQSSLQSRRPIVFTKPVELDWRSLTWPSIDYSRIPIDGGAAIYNLPSDLALKFRIDFVFPGGVYSLPRADRPALGAMTDLLLLGGSGKLNFDEIQNFMTEYGINIKTYISPEGQLVISADALTADFIRVVNLLTNIILFPRFDAASLPLWQQESNDSFQNLLNSNTFDKQNRFIDREAMSLAFGNKHYFAGSLDRLSPAITNSITLKQVKKIYKKVINKNGLNVFISGKFDQKDLIALGSLVAKLPYQEPPVKTWLPSRKILPHSSILTEVITKPGMTQCNVSLRYYFSHLGKLNPIEKTQIDIISDIFSSTGGIVGNDRFSKVMRADSGISYSPRAYFADNVLFPNTNVGMYNLSFQSPNERIAEAVSLATDTWNSFIKNGVTQDELDNTRTSMMNRMLAKELTVFDKTDLFMSQIMKGRVPDINPIETALVKLDKQRSVEDINETLVNLAHEQMVPVLVIMGNPTDEQINQLKKIKGIELAGVKDISEIINSLGGQL